MISRAFVACSGGSDGSSYFYHYRDGGATTAETAPLHKATTMTSSATRSRFLLVVAVLVDTTAIVDVAFVEVQQWLSSTTMLCNEPFRYH